MSARGLAAIVMMALAGACGGSSTEAEPSPTSERRSVATEWFLRSVSDDGRKVKIVYMVSGAASDCERPAGAAVSSSSEVVNITAYKSVTNDKDRACTEELGYIDESVKLSEPLGERALVGCRPPRRAPTEHKVCRSLKRSRTAGAIDRD